jgi:hypothetical protein
MLKLVAFSTMLLMLSGCCELFGICTSVNVHTSISSPDKFASAEFGKTLDSMDALGFAQPAVSGRPTHAACVTSAR